MKKLKINLNKSKQNYSSKWNIYDLEIIKELNKIVKDIKHQLYILNQESLELDMSPIEKEFEKEKLMNLVENYTDLKECLKVKMYLRELDDDSKYCDDEYDYSEEFTPQKPKFMIRDDIEKSTVYYLTSYMTEEMAWDYIHNEESLTNICIKEERNTIPKFYTKLSNSKIKLSPFVKKKIDSSKIHISHYVDISHIDCLNQRKYKNFIRKYIEPYYAMTYNEKIDTCSLKLKNLNTMSGFKIQTIQQKLKKYARNRETIISTKKALVSRKELLLDIAILKYKSNQKYTYERLKRFIIYLEDQYSELLKHINTTLSLYNEKISEYKKKLIEVKKESKFDNVIIEKDEKLKKMLKDY